MERPVQKYSGFYLGIRGERFKNLIISLLKIGKFKDNLIEKLTDEKTMLKFSRAFTAETIHPEYNYEIYEQLGDLSLNKFIVTYAYNRFPHLRRTEGVKIVARIRNKYGSKAFLHIVADQYNFWEFISASNDMRFRNRKSLLEDTFEAFLGVLESCIDEMKGIGLGYAYVYRILSAIYDKEEISLKYSELFDAKTRLKELFDMYRNELGKPVYEGEIVEDAFKVTLYASRDVDGKTEKVYLAQSIAPLRPDAEERCAKSAIEVLSSHRQKLLPKPYVKSVSREYQYFENPVSEDLLKRTFDVNPENVNELLPTRGRENSIHRIPYFSTVITYHCFRRDLDEIEMCMVKNANPNIHDSSGFTALDALLVGSYNPKVVAKALKSLLSGIVKPALHRSTFEIYYAQYTNSAIEKQREHFTKVGTKFEILD
jgi:dsRNA-specific ribonuclease